MTARVHRIDRPIFRGAGMLPLFRQWRIVRGHTPNSAANSVVPINSGALVFLRRLAEVFCIALVLSVCAVLCSCFQGKL